MEEFIIDILPDFNDWIKEDKSKYQTATDAGFDDPDNDFLIGESGGFLMNISFTFTDTHLFCATGNVFEENGAYIDADIDSPSYTKFRRKEEHRRKKGHTALCKRNKDGTVSNLRITGEHYNFLNYVRILALDPKSVRGSSGTKKVMFPRFFDSQYWYYKIKEFSKNNGFHVIVNKTRRGGFTYMEGKGSANYMNLYPNSTIILAAFDKKYVTKGNSIAPMVLDQLEFYEESTPFKRGILTRDLENLQLGYKDKDGNKQGYKSRCLAVSTGPANPDAAIGKDGQELKLEELGNFPNFNEFMEMTTPTVTTGAYLTGHIVGFGTVNSDNETNELFEANFKNPKKWRFMGFENVWDKDSRHKVVGYFKPFWWGLEGNDGGEFAMDENGNSDFEVSKRVVINERKDKWDNKDTLKDYVNYCGQYANNPDEAFSNATENLFTSPALTAQIKLVKEDKSLHFYRDGKFEEINGNMELITNERLLARGDSFHPFINWVGGPKDNMDNHGCFREFYPPFKIDGKIPDNLYRIWNDPFGVDKKSKDLAKYNSFACFYVYMRPNTYTNNVGDILVGTYVGRPDKMVGADKILLDASKRYNAKVLSENDRGETISNFRLWKETGRLVAEPNFSWDSTIKGNLGRTWGVSVGHTSVKLAGIQAQYEWVYRKRGIDSEGNNVYNLHYIYDLHYLMELEKWGEGKNLDRVSAITVGMFDLKQLDYDKIPVKPPVKERNSVFGRTWYTDS